MPSDSAATPITLLAPLPPLRGGISRHSNALLRALAGQAGLDVYAEGFARLYPSFLYPGESMEDPSQESTLALPIHRDLDTLNPLSWRRVARRIAQRGGILVIPAWTFFTAPCLGWIARAVRRRGVEVVMLVHNVTDHEQSWWKSRLSRWQLAAADRFVTHTPELSAQLRDRGLSAQISEIPHPPYADFPPAEGRLPREKPLELLCFGLVRHYKGVDIALDALELGGLEHVRLTIAGEVWADAAGIAERARTLGNVELVNCYVSDQEAAEYFARADAVLLPYRSVTGSGVLAMARHYRRPVIASDLPALRREIDADRLGWTFPTGDAAALAQLLRTAITRQQAVEISAAMPSDPVASGWDKMARAIAGIRSN